MNIASGYWKADMSSLGHFVFLNQQSKKSNVARRQIKTMKEESFAAVILPYSSATVAHID